MIGTLPGGCDVEPLFVVGSRKGSIAAKVEGATMIPDVPSHATIKRPRRLVVVSVPLRGRKKWLKIDIGDSTDNALIFRSQKLTKQTKLV